MVYNETTDVFLHLVFLDRGPEPVRGTIIKPQLVTSNSCLLTALFNKISLQVDLSESTGGVAIRIPKY